MTATAGAPVAVTGAAGKTGRAVVSALAQRGVAVRAFVRDAHHAPTARAAGADEVVVGELDDSDALEKLVRHCAAVYHICPNMHPHEERIGCALLQAALAQRVPPHFVYHSVLRPQIEAMPHHWAKLRVEEALLASRWSFTILQPAPYMQNILAQRGNILRDGLYQAPYSYETCTALVDLADVAEAAARVITEPDHHFAVYELVGQGAVEQWEIALQLGAALGHEVRFVEQDRAEWEEEARARGLSDYTVTGLLAMFRYYEQYGLPGSPRVLHFLLGRAPTTLQEFARRELAPPL